MSNRKYKVFIYFVGLGIQREFYFSKGLTLKQNIDLARVLIIRNEMFYIATDYTVYYLVKNKLTKLDLEQSGAVLENCNELYLF